MNQKEKLKLFRKTPAYKQISRWCNAINCGVERAKERKRLSLLALQRTEEGDWVKDVCALLEFNSVECDLLLLFKWCHTEEGHDFWDAIYES